VTELLKQAQYSPLPISLMGATLFAVNKGYLDDVDVKKVLAFEHGLHQHLKSKPRRPAGQAREATRRWTRSRRRTAATIAAFKKSFA
jgi:F-type H+-transporting ATPase subunit alpha